MRGACCQASGDSGRNENGAGTENGTGVEPPNRLAPPRKIARCGKACYEERGRDLNNRWRRFMQDEDLLITREDEEAALREAVRLGYMAKSADGKIVMTPAGMRRVEGMVWVHGTVPRQGQRP
jgi:hypothetical protein